jgi:hypothetical protein
MVTNINKINGKINTYINFLIESFAKKNKFMLNESVNMEKMTDMKNKILIQLREISSYKEIVENY